MGRAGGRARAIPRERIPALDGGARRRRQSCGGAPRLRAMPPAPRRGTRGVSVTRNRVGLPRLLERPSARSPRGTGRTRSRHRRSRPTNPQRLAGVLGAPRSLAGASRQPRRSVAVLPWPGRRRVRTRGGKLGGARPRRTRSTSSAPPGVTCARQVAVGQAPTSVAVGDGAVWAANGTRHGLPHRSALGDGTADDLGRRQPGAGSPSATAASGSQTTATTRSPGSTPRRTPSCGRSTSARGRPPSPTATARSGSRTATTAP